MKIKLNSTQRDAACLTKNEVSLLNAFLQIEQPIRMETFKVKQFRVIRELLRLNLIAPIFDPSAVVFVTPSTGLESGVEMNFSELNVSQFRALRQCFRTELFRQVEEDGLPVFTIKDRVIENLAPFCPKLHALYDKSEPEVSEPAADAQTVSA